MEPSNNLVSYGSCLDLSKNTRNRVLHLYSPENEKEDGQILGENSSFVSKYAVDVCIMISSNELYYLCKLKVFYILKLGNFLTRVNANKLFLTCIKVFLLKLKCS